MYDVNYFIKKFEAIPEHLWCVGSRGTDDSSKEKCAYGHCGVSLMKFGNQPLEALDFTELFKTHFGSRGEFYINLDWVVVSINDKVDMVNSTPKQRILAALYKIRDKELSEANVIEASKIVNEVVCHI